jgi:hypothetical protein
MVGDGHAGHQAALPRIDAGPFCLAISMVIMIAAMGLVCGSRATSTA